MGKVSHTITINASPEEVWAIISDVKRLPEWAYREGSAPYPTETRYGSEQDEGQGTIWIGKSADGQEATQLITVWEPPTKLSYELQQIEHSATPMRQTNTLTLEGTANGTQVTWQVDWELTGGFSLSKLLRQFTGGGTFEEMVEGSLENLKRLVETA